ncbi:LysR family transcriptional regulator [Variovorax sp. J31P179]|uniref:LysR family transcriptional regulator n=1 Tax=Variovorax sp. J31P179 TaxID=3053508 RepID=UPI002578B5B0|nr:LysR family transcriptional regulator [Variovorax sp. J31P179]MDM0084737.1 LysR family transcriptional regulator [Variovorax sp. J31P179]
MDTYQHVKTFALVARYGGFSEAARQLGVVPSVVAKRIGQLEKHLGTRLFERTTRAVRLTEAGEKFQSRAGTLVQSFDELLESVSSDESKLEGHLRVMAPTTLTMLFLGEALCRFLSMHDGITLELALVDLSTNPAEQGFDVAISGRSASYEGVVDIPLCPVDAVVCATPGYLSAHGLPAHPRELVDHSCLCFKPSGPSWQFQTNRGTIAVDLRPRLLADDNRTLLAAALAGLGIAALPAYVARQALDDGSLLKVLPSFALQETWFRAHVPKRRQGVARVSALVTWLSQELASERWRQRK